MDVYKVFMNNYIQELKGDYILKNNDIYEASHKSIFKHKSNNSYLSLKDILDKKTIIQSSIIQNEINSINDIQKDKFIIFKTTTLDPEINISEDIYNIENLEEFKLNQSKDLEKLNNIHIHDLETFSTFNIDKDIQDYKDKQNKELQSFKNKQDKKLYEKQYSKLEEQLKNQYEEMNLYFKHISNMNDKKKLKYKNIRIYELTELLNLHSHKIDLLDNQEDFISYIESLFLSRNKFNIGRVELVVDINFFNVIEKYFKDKKIKVRINNKYTYLTLIKKVIKKENKTMYYIKETEKGKGNFIYFRTIEQLTETDKDYIASYLFKYMLKTYDIDNKHISKETLVFNKLKFKQKIYSTNFYTDKLNKDELEKLNNKFFTYFKMEENNKKTPLSYLKKEDYEFIVNNKNSMFSTLSSLLNRNVFKYREENIIEMEYLNLKNQIEIKLNDYDYKTKFKFNHYLKNELYSMFEDDVMIRIFPLIEKKFNEEQDYEILVDILLTAIFDYLEDSYKDLENYDYEDNHLIGRLTQAMFKFFEDKFKYSNEKVIYYINNEMNSIVEKDEYYSLNDIIKNKDLEEKQKIYLPTEIIIHEFKTNYEFNKYSHDIELYYDLLSDDFNFNNEQEKLITYIKLINSLSEYLEVEERLTLEQIQEEYKSEIEENRKGRSERIENLILENFNDTEFNKGLLNYYNTLTEEQKLKYYNEQDLSIQKILKGE